MIEDFYLHEPYELDKETKNRLLTKELKELTSIHRKKCMEYDRFLNAIQYEEDNVKSVKDIPFSLYVCLKSMTC